MTHTKKFLFAAALAGLACSASAQTNGSNSPYSRYGFGLMNDGGQGFNKGMSGTGLGMRHGKQLNAQNPASYSAIDSTSFLFDIGMSMQLGKLSWEGNKATAKNTSIDYISMGFRLAKGLGMSIGALPYTTIGYSLADYSTFDRGNTGQVVQYNQYDGEGGLHYAYAGLGWEPVKNLSVGMNAGYLWGTQSHVVSVSFLDASIAATRRTYAADIRTYKLDFGAQFTKRLTKKDVVTLGATYSLGHGIRSAARFYDQSVLNTAVTGGDTLSTKNAFELPHAFGVGLGWQHGRSWRFGVDYTLQKWGTVKYPALKSAAGGGYTYLATKDQFSDRSKLSIGAEYVPNPEGVKRAQRVRYRMGASMANSYTKINGQDGPRDYQVSLGVGLPILNFHNNRSLLNIAAQYERVEPRFPGQIAENYFRISIGLSFNENWFAKWRVE